MQQNLQTQTPKPNDSIIVSVAPAGTPPAATEAEMQDRIVKSALDIADHALKVTKNAADNSEEMLSYAKVAETAVKIYKTIRGDAEAESVKAIKSVEQLIAELAIDASQTTININAPLTQINAAMDVIADEKPKLN